MRSMGTTGEYSDRIRWPVLAHYSKESAEDHVVKAEEKAREWQVERGKNSCGDPPEGWSEYDPEMQMDYTGTSYYYYEVELK